jgi:3-deoxy-D-manno-octulosonic-acid transferase
VGEVNVLGTIIAKLEARRPDAELFISATTTTGFNLARRRFATHTVCYCPLDFTWAVTAALRRVRPDLLVLAELELWPNLVTAAQQRGAAIAIVNGRLSDKSFRGYRRFRWFVAGLLQRISLIAVQDKTTADRFLNLGAAPERVHITGSLKYDGAQTNRNNPATTRLRGLAPIAAGDVVLLAGSTQEPEEELVLAAYRSLMGDFPELRLIIVPRHPQRFEAVADLLERSGLTWVRRSSLGSEKERPVLLVDTVGELGAWWGVADLAFVGGSLGSRGGQNMIEPAAYGAAVCFGPNTRNFRDIVAAMLHADAARVVADGTELTAFVRRCLEDPEWAKQLGERARRLVVSQQGATGRTLALLDPLLPRPFHGNTRLSPRPARVADPAA